MKKFKILHLPTALYVWECEDPDCSFFMADNHTTFVCNRKTILESYLSEQINMEISGGNILLWNIEEESCLADEACMPFKRHEFEIIEVEDEEV